MSQGDSEWRGGSLILLGSIPDYFSMIAVYVIVTNWLGWDSEQTGILMGYMLILFAPAHLLGLLFSIGLVHWLRNRGSFWRQLQARCTLFFSSRIWNIARAKVEGLIETLRTYLESDL